MKENKKKNKRLKKRLMSVCVHDEGWSKQHGQLAQPCFLGEQGFKPSWLQSRNPGLPRHAHTHTPSSTTPNTPNTPNTPHTTRHTPHTCLRPAAGCHAMPCHPSQRLRNPPRKVLFFSLRPQDNRLCHRKSKYNRSLSPRRQSDL